MWMTDAPHDEVVAVRVQEISAADMESGRCLNGPGRKENTYKQ
jgi:hypothetical protein